MKGIDRSVVPADRPLFDVRAVYREKHQAISQFGDSTLDARVRTFGDASVLDYLLFPSRPLVKRKTPFFFARRPNEARIAARLNTFDVLPGRTVGDPDRFLARTLTTSFIVIQNDSIVYEQYFNGWGRDSIVTSFSAAKSFTSTLVGIAIEKGLIHSVTDPITTYLPELAQRDARFGRITITDLLQTGIWGPLGMEFGGSWSLDSKAHGFEKMESGINARAIDFAKFGRLFLHHGEWDGRRVVSAEWVTDAIQPWTASVDYYGDDTFFAPDTHYYRYMRW